MGRRALRKLATELDLSSWLYTLESPALTRPFDPAPFFPQPGPLEIEVGSGKGLFLQTACESQPERNFWGIELAKKYAAHCAARLAKRQLTNGRMLSGDAIRFFEEWLGDASVDAVHVYFPDPWWKKRHHKRRVMNESFVRQIERVLRPGGRLHFWTDVEEYFQGTLEILREHTALCGPLPVPERQAEHRLKDNRADDRAEYAAGIAIGAVAESHMPQTEQDRLKHQRPCR